jgi:hypothetical protein
MMKLVMVCAMAATVVAAQEPPGMRPRSKTAFAPASSAFSTAT